MLTEGKHQQHDYNIDPTHFLTGFLATGLFAVAFLAAAFLAAGLLAADFTGLAGLLPALVAEPFATFLVTALPSAVFLTTFFFLGASAFFFTTSSFSFGFSDFSAPTLAILYEPAPFPSFLAKTSASDF